ncbi:GNAT family N-acetyltransferase, partial [Pseudomonas syringae pv. tagetis]
MVVVIRVGLPVDLPGILSIYFDEVIKSMAIWNDQLADLANRLAWYASRQSQAY